MAGSSSEASHKVDLSAAYLAADFTAQDWLIIAPIALTIFSGGLLLALRKRTELQFPLALIAMGILCFFNFQLLRFVVAEGPQTMTMGRWLPPFGISFTVDTLGALLSLTASVVAFIALIFASREIGWLGKRYGFYPFVMLLMTGVSGSFLTGDIFNLYVWFEVLLISSFGLLVLGSEKLQIDGTIKYAFLNLIATTIFLIATGLLYGQFGTLNMADITSKVAQYTQAGESYGPLYTIVALYMLGFGMKAAAFPLNFWLPASYHTPRIVVSALFAGLLTKVGVYAFARTLTMIFGPIAFGEAYVLAGFSFAQVIGCLAILTMVLGALGALAQDDVRKLAGYLVIVGIGMMLGGVALDSEASLSATIAYAVHSMIVMTALYVGLGLAGAISGSYSLRDMGGLYARSPLFAAFFLILAFAVAGLPPFSGFWPKLVLVRAGIDADHWWLVGAILLSGFVSTIALGRVWAYGFWRGGPAGTEDGALSIDHLEKVETKTLFNNVTLASFCVLVMISVLLGVFAEPLQRVSNQAAAGLTNSEAYINSVFPEHEKVATENEARSDHSDSSHAADDNGTDANATDENAGKGE